MESRPAGRVVTAQGVEEFPHVAVVWVGIEQDDDGQYRWVDQIHCLCMAPEWAPCRTYPDCEHHWPCGCEAFPAKDCWIIPWIDGLDAYTGPDGEDGVPPPVARVGQITATWEGDYLEWRWTS